MTAPDSTTSGVCRKCGAERPIDEFLFTDPFRRYRCFKCRECRNEESRRNRLRRKSFAAEIPSPRSLRDIGPDDRIVVNGLDVTWMFVEFREIRGFPFYRASSLGDIWGCQRRGAGSSKSGAWRKLVPRKAGKGYLQVTLCNGPVRRAEYIHTLVMEAFIGPRPVGMECCHSPDPDVTNNALRNLRWGTPVENSRDQLEHGTRSCGVDRWNARLTDADVVEAWKMMAGGKSAARIADWFGVSPQTIEDVFARRTWKHVPIPDVE